MSTAPNSEFRLLIFDWDGTLMDSIPTIVACTQATLAEVGLARSDDETIQDGIGLGLRETVERFAPGADRETFDQICLVYRRLWFETYSKIPSLFDGVEEMMHRLRADGFSLAIATGKSRKGLDHDQSRVGLRNAFDASKTADEARSKPHPQMIVDLLSELDVWPARALTIGDASHDLEMAHNADVRSVAVLTGAHSREKLEAATPLACLDRATDLLDWLDERQHATDRAARG